MPPLLFTSPINTKKLLYYFHGLSDSPFFLAFFARNIFSCFKVYNGRCWLLPGHVLKVLPTRLTWKTRKLSLTDGVQASLLLWLT